MTKRTCTIQPRFDLLGIGNALVDVLSHASDDFITAQEAFGMTRGSMALIGQDRAESLYGQMGPCIETSGGSVANSLASFAMLGGRGAYIGKVANDQLGKVFQHDIRAQGVHFDTAPLTDGTSTGRCLILVTPDAQRTMNTFLGAANQLCPDDICEKTVSDSAITYLEGYLFDSPANKDAFRKAACVAREAGRQVALSLSDPFCVTRHRDDFLALIRDHVDILFANEAEISTLYGMSFDESTRAVKAHCDLAILTRSEKGALILSNGQETSVEAVKPAQLIDTTGAGDAFSAGYLFGHTRGLDPACCGRIGAICASEVISHMGPRPEKNLAELAAPVLARPCIAAE